MNCFDVLVRLINVTMDETFCWQRNIHWRLQNHCDSMFFHCKPLKFRIGIFTLMIAHWHSTGTLPSLRFGESHFKVGKDDEGQTVRLKASYFERYAQTSLASMCSEVGESEALAVERNISPGKHPRFKIEEWHEDLFKFFLPFWFPLTISFCWRRRYLWSIYDTDSLGRQGVLSSCTRSEQI